MKIRKRSYSGTTQAEARDYETAHRKVARDAAAAGIVLLKNEGHLLPVSLKEKIAVYGAGSIATIKGGSGSGDVNARETVSVYQGLVNAGYTITNEEWLEDYRKRYAQARLDWRAAIWKKADDMHLNWGLWAAYTTTPFVAPKGAAIEKTDAEIALYVLTRTAGEGADRFDEPGDYELTQDEKDELHTLGQLYKHLVLVLNVGGVIDLSVLDEVANIEAVVYLHQAGMEAGNAFADIFSGKVTPSGKLTDSMAFHYMHYPNSASFSHNNGNVDKEIYAEDIYVGYRYFNTFKVPVRYPFGFGLSYASFMVKTIGMEACDAKNLDSEVKLHVQVTNTSAEYAGKEVVQLYAACDAFGGDREYKRLVAFKKTKLLAPGDCETVTLSFPLRAIRHFDEKLPGWKLPCGEYGMYVGTSVQECKLEGVLCLTGKEFQQETLALCPPQQDFQRMKANSPVNLNRYRTDRAKNENAFIVELNISDLRKDDVHYGAQLCDVSEEAKQMVDSLTVEELIQLNTGEVTKNQGGAQVGAAGITVPGAAAETTTVSSDKGIAEIVLADGPAGLRLIKKYYPEAIHGAGVPFDMAVEDGFLVRGKADETGPVYYQYCTAIPVGTVLAQTWDPAVVAACGSAVAEEMEIFDVTLWLAPGMNIHRNPLCGRNFEYFAEDPLVAGVMAAAMTNGVQQHAGMCTTIKHFACNNQEDNRTYSDSVLSQRALRELYWLGFEIAVRLSQPKAIMTSYNLINGVHAANNHDLCTKLLRNEWGFKGLVMTDWGTTNGTDDCSASKCVNAGNDITMPGTLEDHEDLRRALENGTMKLEDLKHSDARLVDIILQSRRYE